MSEWGFKFLVFLYLIEMMDNIMKRDAVLSVPKWWLQHSSLGIVTLTPTLAFFSLLAAKVPCTFSSPEVDHFLVLDEQTGGSTTVFKVFIAVRGRQNQSCRR